MSVEHFIFSESRVVVKAVEEAQLLEYGDDMNTVRVVLTSGDEHHFHHARVIEHKGYTVLENGALAVGVDPGLPHRIYSSSGWAFVEGSLAIVKW
jgi:hypothetical protein